MFESACLTEPVEILGAPEVALELSADKPVAMVAVRLSDVAPDDKVTRVTYGLLNLTHREGDERPTALKPGTRYRVTVRLNHIAHAFPVGHRLRIALSTSYWPIAWPPPEPVRLTVFTSDSTLMLPVQPPRAADDQISTFGEPEGAAYPATTTIMPHDQQWNVIRDLASDITTLEVVKDEGVVRIDGHGLEVERTTTERYSHRYGEFNSVKGEVFSTLALRRGDWSVKTIIRTALTSTATHFRFCADLDDYEGGWRIYCRTWDKTIPRDLV